MIELADIIYAKLQEEGYNYPMKRQAIAHCNLKFFSYFSSEAASILPFCNKPAKTLVNDRSKEILGIEYKNDAKELLWQTAQHLMKTGTIPTKR